MSKNGCQLESLPNEIIIEIFRYFETRDLFQAFYNLNHRFNTLVQSLTHLIYSTNKTDNLPISYPFIYTLVINTSVENTLTCFPNVHRIILDYVTDNLMTQLNSRVLPYLEYLSISHKVSPFYMPDLRGKIFSNAFPNLKYCYISRMKPAYTLREWTQSSSLRYLKVNEIDASVYTSILLACPNLYFFKFKLPTRLKLEPNNVSHTNLKRLVINMNYDEWPWDDTILEGYLLCVPNLEEFRVSRSISVDSNIMNSFQSYDWLLSIISKYLLLLNQFIFDLSVKRSNGFIEYDHGKICQCFKTKFNNVYKGRFQSRLVIF